MRNRNRREINREIDWNRKSYDCEQVDLILFSLAEIQATLCLISQVKKETCGKLNSFAYYLFFSLRYFIRVMCMCAPSCIILAVICLMCFLSSAFDSHHFGACYLYGIWTYTMGRCVHNFSTLFYSLIFSYYWLATQWTCVTRRFTYWSTRWKKKRETKNIIRTKKMENQQRIVRECVTVHGVR